MHTMTGLCLICILVTLSACVPSHSSVEKYVEEVKKTEKSKLEPIPPVQKIVSVDYTAESLRSPFALTGGSYTNVQQVITGPGGELIQQAPRPDLDRPREYLEQFPLSSLAMVGFLSNPEDSWGLVQDSNGMIHAVKIGDYIGLNSGKIIAITPDQIKINETVPNGTGGWMDNKNELALVIANTEATAPTTTTKAKPQKGSAATPAVGGQGAGAIQRPASAATPTPTPGTVQQQQPQRPAGARGGGGF